jgi:carbonic anhydrase
MTLLDDILAFNAVFVRNRQYEPFRTGTLHNKNFLILTCMDSRLVELLPHAMNVHNGDVKIIKNAGALVTHPFGSVMRSILVGVYKLNVREIAVIGHHDCGMTGLNSTDFLARLPDFGISDITLSTLKNAGIDFENWLRGFDRPEDGVRQSVDMIRRHPLLPAHLPVHGLVISPETGKLDLICSGYEATKKNTS